MNSGRFRLRTLWFFAAFTAISAPLAAEGDPRYTAITIASEKDARQSETVFRSDTDKIFLRANLVDQPANGTLTCSWIAVQVADVPPDEVIAKVDLAIVPGGNTLNCNLNKPDAGFPVGDYRVDLFVNDKKTNEARFSVKASAEPVTAVSSAPARRSFKIVNRTGYDISEVYLSPAKKKDWEEDMLEDDELEDGDEQVIRFSRTEKTCNWDLKVVYSDDDSEAIWYNVDLCKVSKITIKYDRKSDKTSAVFD